MNDQPSLFDEPAPISAVVSARVLARRTDPDTAQAAAAAASKRGPSQRKRVYNALVMLGAATDYELSVATGILRSSAAKRRQELTTLGYVLDTGERRATDTGTSAIVWKCVQGRPAYDDETNSNGT